MGFGAMNIAAASVSQAKSNFQVRVATSVTKMAMNSADLEAQAIKEMMPPVSPDGIGAKIDVKA